MVPFSFFEIVDDDPAGGIRVGWVGFGSERLVERGVVEEAPDLVGIVGEERVVPILGEGEGQHGDMSGPVGRQSAPRPASPGDFCEGSAPASFT